MREADDTRRAVVEDLLAAGRKAGFAAVGVAGCDPSEHAARLEAWLARGAHAGMSWMADTADVRKDLRKKWPWARTALVGALQYLTEPLERARLAGLGRFICRYARGRDYHDEVKERLREWTRDLDERAGRPVRRAILVDTSAVLEREMAARAGVGWIGKNCCLYGDNSDSWRVLGLVLTDLDLQPTGPRLAERCGTCRACLDACPTGAISEPWFVDANRCISYLTIEHRGPIPADLAPALGDWLFGCDVCQEVCPHNRRAAPAGPRGFAVDERYASVTLADLLRMDETKWRATFRGAPLWRARRAGLLRNALLVAANTGDGDALAAARGLLDDRDPTVAETARRVLARVQRP